MVDLPALEAIRRAEELKRMFIEEEKWRKEEKMSINPLDIKGEGYKGFAPEFDNLNDIRMRLERSIILAGEDPVLITDIVTYKKDYCLYVYHPEQGEKNILYKEQRDKLDLRGPGPRYVRHQNKTWYLRRIPARQQRQGLNRDNSRLTSLDEGKSRIQETTTFCHDLFNRKVVKWDAFLERVLKERIADDFPLTDHVAVYGKDLKVGFKGRFLGYLKEDKVLLQEEDYDKSWIRKALVTAGLGAAHA